MKLQSITGKLSLAQIIALAALLLVMAPRQAAALWVEQQVTAQNPVTPHLKFSVQPKDVAEGLKNFEVTVTAQAGYTISPVALARLTIKDGDTTLALVPVEVQQEGNVANCWFRIAPQYIAGAKFEFDDQGYGETKDAQGKTRYIALPGGVGYWLNVSEFAVAPH